MTYEFLARERESGRYLAVSVNGARGQREAMAMIENGGIQIVNLESSRQVANEKANQLNAANGIVVGGCANC